jgi:biopolymer transport protein ExbB/TolQ
MTKKDIPVEFVFQLFALIISIIVVHAYYTAVVRPNAVQDMADQAEAVKADPTYVAPRSVWVLLKDPEQESCVILMFWAFAIIGYKFRTVIKERRLLDVDLVPVDDGLRILPEDSREFARQVQALPDERRDMLLPRALLAALRRFDSTHNIQDVSATTHSICESEADRLDTELSMIRYIAWAIPAIGFIGTVRGIGDALAQADKAVQGDIAGVTASLGVAFNSTLIALLISIVLMFLVHQLQAMQERLVFEAESYCDEKLIRHMRAGG